MFAGGRVQKTNVSGSGGGRSLFPLLGCSGFEYHHHKNPTRQKNPPQEKLVTSAAAEQVYLLKDGCQRMFRKPNRDLADEFWDAAPRHLGRAAVDHQFERRVKNSKSGPFMTCPKNLGDADELMKQVRPVLNCRAWTLESFFRGADFGHSLVCATTFNHALRQCSLEILHCFLAHWYAFKA